MASILLVAYYLSAILWSEHRPASILIGVFSLLLFLYHFRNLERKWLLFPVHLLFLLLGIVWGISYVHSHILPQASVPATFHYSGIATIDSLSTNSAILKLDALKWRIKKPAELAFSIRGDSLKVSCTATAYSGSGNVFTSLEKLQGIAGRCEDVQKVELLKEKDSLSQRLYRHIFTKLESPFSRSVLLADTSALEPWQLSAYRNMGIAHLFAASGLHLALFFSLIYLPLKFLSLERTGYILALIASFFFLYILDFNLSLLRAFLFVFIYFILRALDIRTGSLFVLLNSAILSELIFPGGIFSASFILSYGVTAAILFSFASWKKYIPQRWPDWLKDHTAITLSAFTGSIFFSWFFFAQANPLSFIYNFILVPISSLHLPLVIGSVFFPWMDALTRPIEQIFEASAYIHYRYLQLPGRNPPTLVVYAWLIVAGIISVLYPLSAYRRRHWILRKYRLILPVLLGIPLVFMFPIPSKESGYYVFPYGVAEIANKEMRFYGSLASFANLRDPLTKSCSPVNSVQAPLELQQNMSRYFPSVQALSSSSLYGGILQTPSACYFFSAKADPAEWKKISWSHCKTMILLESKAQKLSEKEWEPFFRMFGFRGSIEKAGYGKWICSST